MKVKALLLTLLIISPFYRTPAQNPPDEWEIAEREIKRLPPAAYPELPGNIVQELQARGCTIPQTYADPNPHNVIRGEFAKPGQQDWAVLCSVNRTSSILIFWAGSVEDTSEVHKVPDRDMLQGRGSGQLSYSREIYPADKEYIEEHYERYRDAGASEPPPIDHEGINDAFIEKGSTVHYLYEGKWLELAGAD